MATFESKVSDIFAENPTLAGKIPVVIRGLFNESESEFKRRMANETEAVENDAYLRVFDILFIDLYFDELNDRFLSWVIDHHSEQFTESELEEMRAQANSHLDFYEVQEVFLNKGSLIKSLITGEEGFLQDRSSSRHIVKWDIFRARCYRFRGDYYATGAFSLFRPSDKKYIVKRIKEAMSESGETEYADFAKDNWMIFSQVERELRQRELNKKYYTKYGEVQLCEVRFRVNNLNAALNEIARHEDFDFVETKIRRDRRKKRDVRRYEFEWTTQSIENELESIKTVDDEDGIMISSTRLTEDGEQTGIEFIGNLYIDQLLCRLETRSLEVAEFAVQYFARIFGDALTFKRIIKKKINFAQKPKTNSEKASEAEQFARMNPELVRELGEKLYLNLLDEKVPALGGKTPRDARNDPELLPLLVEWLKSMENFFERAKHESQVTIPIEKLKKELDIDY